jgi:hypothetical protein
MSNNIPDTEKRKHQELIENITIYFAQRKTWNVSGAQLQFVFTAGLL